MFFFGWMVAGGTTVWAHTSVRVGMPAQTSLETLGSICLSQDAGQQRTTVQPNYAKVTSAVEDNIEHLMRAYGSLAAEIDPRIG